LRKAETLAVPIVFVVLATLAGRQQAETWGTASSDSSQVCLDLPETAVDWKATAIAALGRERFAHPSTQVLRSALQPEGGNTVAVQFRAAVPASVQARSWTVFYSGGAVVVHPTELRGSVLYFVNSKLTLTRAPVASGAACAPWRDASSAAFFASDFVISGSRIVSDAVTPVGRDTFAISVEGRTLRFRRPDFVTAGASHVTLYSSTHGDTLALIEWDPGDGSTCGHQFTLITLVPATRAPVDNGYDCDI